MCRKLPGYSSIIGSKVFPTCRSALASELISA